MSAPDYQPFPLMDFEVGLYDAKESWLAPPASFESIENGRVFRGQLLKRPGYERFGKLGQAFTETLDPGGGDNPLVTPPTNAPLLKRERPPSLYKVRIYEDGGGFQEAFDQPLGVSSDLGLLVMQVNEVMPTAQVQDYQLLKFKAFVGSYLNQNIAAVQASADFYELTDPDRRLPADRITATDAGSGQVAYVSFGDFNSKSEGGPAIWNVRGDVDAGGINQLQMDHPTLIVDRIKFTFAAAATGVVTLSYQEVIGTINYATGAISLTWPVGTMADVKIDYEFDRQLPVMGIFNFFTDQGNEFLVALNTRRLWEYSTIEQRFYERDSSGNDPTDVTVGDTFSGADSDFFHAAPFEDVLILVNNIDRPKKYSPLAGPPGTLTDMGTNYDANVGTGQAITGNDIDNAEMVFRHKGRLVYLSTKENGSTFPRRARWTPINDVEYVNAIGEEEEYFTDAATDDTFVTAEYVGEELICAFRRSFWRLRYTGESPEAAFIFERIPAAEGAQGKMSVARLSEEIVMRGEKSIVGTDGVSERPIDEQIPDFTLKWNKDAARYSYSTYSKELRQWLMTYADQGESVPGHVLSVQIDEQRRTKSYAVYALPFHCFGEYRQSTSQTMNTTFVPMNQINYSMNSAAGQEGFPLVLAGDRLGNVWNFGYVNTDDGTPIDLTARFIRLNPFPWERCHLGWVDVICSAKAGDEIRVTVYRDYKQAPYYNETRTVQASDIDSDSEKVKRRFLVNKIANFHAIEVVVSSSKSMAIDAVTPWFVPAGQMREIA